MIVADYVRPAALMVPHYDVTILETLEAVATAASRWIGVILLSGDPARTRRFIDGRARPERFAIVGAAYDTGWIRDRSPLAIRRRGGYEWVLPRRPPSERERDDALFERISARPTRGSTLYIPQGNLVAGPLGVAFSTTQILQENGLSDESRLSAFAGEVGIGRWLTFEPLEGEMSGHADMYLRFLRRDLVALGWPPGGGEARKTAERLEARVRMALRSVKIMRLPVRMQGKALASPLNWIQIGRQLLVPRFDITPDEDLARIGGLLRDAGFRPRFIASPTLEYGGSLHCLTASIYI